MPVKKITVEVECKNPLAEQNIEASLKKLASLEFDDRQRISEIMASPKALKSLADNWRMLSGMFK